jgi:hypothetical protein
MVPAASEGLGLYKFVRAVVRGSWVLVDEGVPIHTLHAVFKRSRPHLEHRHGFPAAPLLLTGGRRPGSRYADSLASLQLAPDHTGGQVIDWKVRLCRQRISFSTPNHVRAHRREAKGG